MRGGVTDHQDGLKIVALAGLFRHTKNSYKFILFLALLDLLKRHRFEDYFQDFVALQHQGLVIASRILPGGQFVKLTEDHLADLHLPSPAALLDLEQLTGAYERNIGPLITLATNQGFSPDWPYGR